MPFLIFVITMVGVIAASWNRPFNEGLERTALFLLLGFIALILCTCARAPDGSTQWDVGTTVRALSCAHADLSRTDERARCGVEVGR